MTTPRLYPVEMANNATPEGTADGAPPHRNVPTVDARRVASVSATMPDASDIADLADVFSLLGEPSRVRLLIALLSGPMAVRDIAATIKLSESAVSHALRLLRAHRVVDVRRDGRIAYYEIADTHVRHLLEVGLEHVGHTVLIHATTAGDDTCSTTDPDLKH